MGLADFIDAEADLIVAEAVAFARTLAVLSESEEAVLRNHIPEILRIIALDMRTSQTNAASIAKSHGLAAAAHLYSEADYHGKQRAQAGLNIDQLLAEYRSLRASVLRIWNARHPDEPDAVKDITRFNEAIDQAISESVRTFAKEVDSRRQLFLAVLGHDLRGPLNAASLTSTAINNLVPAGPSQLAGLSKVLGRSVKRMAKLLDTLLDYNLVGLGRKMALDRSRIDLQPECEEEVEILRAAFPHVRIQLAMAGDCGGEFDESRIREAISNLVSNAAKHGVTTKPIQVALQGLSETVELTVSNAIEHPLSRAELEALFEPMRRGSHTRDASRSSLGLGLFITQEIAKAHGGQVLATSSDELIYFKIMLPKAAQAL